MICFPLRRAWKLGAVAQALVIHFGFGPTVQLAPKRHVAFSSWPCLVLALVDDKNQARQVNFDSFIN